MLSLNDLSQIWGICFTGVVLTAHKALSRGREQTKVSEENLEKVL